MAAIGDRMRLLEVQTYLKTADPMPMLRPPDLVGQGEIGEVVALHPVDVVAVRFRRGTFLIGLDRLEKLDDEAPDQP